MSVGSGIAVFGLWIAIALVAISVPSMALPVVFMGVIATVALLL